MINGHLESANIKITALSPVFVGSGLDISKKEYIYVPNGHKIHFLDFPKWAEFLEEKGLLHSYQDFMLGSWPDLRAWLKVNKIYDSEYARFTAYSINAGDAVTPGIALKEIKLFTKNSHGQPYLPGSSIKGAIRTAIASKIIRDESRKYADVADSIYEKAMKKDFKLNQESSKIESKAFRSHNLFEGKPGDAVHDLMRGIQISDSIPLGLGSMVLCGKTDVKVRGNEKKIPIYRECIKPGTEINATITMDRNICSKSGIDLEYILLALKEFEEFYEENFRSRFLEPLGSVKGKIGGAPVCIGGGAGFPTKTVMYSLMDRKKAVEITSRLLDKQFKKHKHLGDQQLGVSPHTVKYAKHGGNMYEMGWCDFEVVSG